jgi:hypothetical protein
VPKRRNVDRQPRVPLMDGPDASMDHGVYGPDFFISCKGKKGHGINACVSSSNLTVITDLGSSKRITFAHCFAKAERGRGTIVHVPSPHLTVITDLGSSERISSINRDLTTRYHFGSSQVGISGLASTRGIFPLVFRVPKCRSAEQASFTIKDRN